MKKKPDLGSLKLNKKTITNLNVIVGGGGTTAGTVWTAGKTTNTKSKACPTSYYCHTNYKCPDE